MYIFFCICICERALTKKNIRPEKRSLEKTFCNLPGRGGVNTLLEKLANAPPGQIPFLKMGPPSFLCLNL